MNDIHENLKRRQMDRELEEMFTQCPRYDKHELTDAQIEQIAEKAAKKAMIYAKSEFYQDVGHAVVNKFYWLVGAVVAGSFVWLASKGLIKL